MASTSAKLNATWSKILPGKKKLKRMHNWSIVNDSKFGNYLTLVYPETLDLPNLKPKKLACFDMDGTLWKPKKAGAVFHNGVDDWQYWHSTKVPEMINSLNEDERCLVCIFSNQVNILDDQHKLEEFQGRMENFITSLSPNMRVILLASTHYDFGRKPCPGMWHYSVKRFLQMDEDDSKTLLANSFYVGDAAGRLPCPGQKHKDHSCSDRLFAENLGLRFYTPEEYFLNDKQDRVQVNRPSFNPLEFKPFHTMFSPTSSELFPECDGCEVIMFVGYPACGKTTFYERECRPRGYSHVNLDSFKGNRVKAISHLKSLLSSKCKIVIDETGMDPAMRSMYTKIVREYGSDIPIRCFWFQAELSFAQHLNAFRTILGLKNRIPTQAYRLMSKRFVAPDPETEGFTDLKKIIFIPEFSNLENEADRSLLAPADLFRLHLWGQS